MRFVVEGTPRPWKRTRAGRHTDPSDRSWRDVLGYTFLQDTNGERPYMDGEPLALVVSFSSVATIVNVEKSTLTRRPGLRGDVDNYLKAVADAGSGVLWADDRQLVAVTARFDPPYPPPNQ